MDRMRRKYAGRAKPHSLRLCSKHTDPSNGQFFASAAAAGSKDPASVLGGHPGTEAVHLVALTFLGLISTLHGNNSFKSQKPSGFGMARCLAPQKSYYSISGQGFCVKLNLKKACPGPKNAEGYIRPYALPAKTQRVRTA